MKGIEAIVPFGEHCILVQWEPVICESIHSEILQFQKLVEKTFPSKIIETVPAYNELALYLIPEVALSEFINKLKSLTDTTITKALKVSRREVTIPVCYETNFAEDLSIVASTNDVTETEVIKIHSEATYIVYFLGFLPGFPYLGGLDKRLTTPRLKSPRTNVPKGAVAIGGSQTGVYPVSSPGGWNIIGRTPLKLFSVAEKSPTLLKAGDRIKFEDISEREFQRIEIEVENGTFQLNSKTHD